MANRIVLKGAPLQKEGTAIADDISPGMLLAPRGVAPAGGSDPYGVHNLAGQNAVPLFAIENSLEGEGIDDTYEADDRIQLVHARPGDEIQALLANAQTAVRGDFLESDGTGHLRVHTAASGALDYTNAIVAYADEALDLSGAAGATIAQRQIRVVAI